MIHKRHGMIILRRNRNNAKTGVISILIEDKIIFSHVKGDPKYWSQNLSMKMEQLSMCKVKL